MDVYTEATLERLLNSGDPVCRRAAVLARGWSARWRSTTHWPAACTMTTRWSSSLRATRCGQSGFAAGREHCDRLQHIVSGDISRHTLHDLDVLISRTGDYAEAFNQRAILYYKLGEFRRAAADCETVLKLKAYHYGAAAGMAQCYLK